MRKKIFALMVVLAGCILFQPPVVAVAETEPGAAGATQSVYTDRLSGHTKYETAKVISEYYSNNSVGKIQNVILATGNDFADALSASVLSYEKKAPILLVDVSPADSQEAFDYLRQYFDAEGTVYIVGGVGIIGSEFETKLRELGYQNVVRLAGLNRYNTSYEIASALQQENMSTVVVASGEQFPDALSISSFAARYGYPILLTGREALTSEMRSFLQDKQPDKVYIAGGTGIISESVQQEINGLLPQSNIQRLTGESRFDTNVAVVEAFASKPAVIYVVTGYNFADALAGSALAAKNGDPLLFIDPSLPTLPKSAARYLAGLYADGVSPNLIALGGTGIVSEETMKNAAALLSGRVSEKSIYSIADLTASVMQNEVYNLPTTIPARLYNSEMLDVYVNWSPAVANTGIAGTTVYEGTVEGYSGAAKLTLTVQELPKERFITQYVTYFDAGQANRTENIRLAAKSLDGLVLAPGQRFSFNQTVGERTVSAGYREAFVIEGDEYVLGLGGGICQVSSTLYNAVLQANLEIVERHTHSLRVDYVPVGRDATVAWPVLDFKFRNSRSAKLLISTIVENGSLTIQLYEVDW